MDPAILKDIELFVLDMDGTIYLGERPFPAAIEFIRKAKESGRKVVYFTNNASKNPAVYYEKLLRLGFDAERAEIVTAGDVTAEYLNTFHRGEKVYLVGTPFLEASFREKGIPLTDGSEADIVVSSFDTTLTYEKLERAVHFIRRGAAFVAANPDWVCPMAAGEVMPDCGSICALLTASTGVKPLYIGKPNRSMVDIISGFTGVPNAEICCVGDRLYTDIAVAVNAGAQSVLVMSGETTP